MTLMESAYSLLIGAVILVQVAAMPTELKNQEEDHFGEAFNMLRKMLDEDVFGIGSMSGSNSSSHHIETRNLDAPLGVGRRVVTHVENKNQGDLLNDLTSGNMESVLMKRVNNTLKMGVRDGEDLTKQKETQVGCVEHRDCDVTAYCDKFAYQCKPCLAKGQSCTINEECCPGYRCDAHKKICLETKGQPGDKCDSKDDCSAELCCALNYNGDGVCQPYLKEAENCGKDPFLSFLTQGSLTMQEAFSGLPSRCPCGTGLRCRQQKGILLMMREVCMKPNHKEATKRQRSETRQGLRRASNFIKPLLAFLRAPVRRISESRNQKWRDHRRKRQASDIYGAHRSLDNEENRPYGVDEVGERESGMRTKRRLPIDIENAFLVPADELEVMNEMDGIDEDRVPEREYNGQKRGFIEDFTDFRNYPKQPPYEENLDAVFENIMKGIIRAMRYVF